MRYDYLRLSLSNQTNVVTPDTGNTNSIIRPKKRVDNDICHFQYKGCAFYNKTGLSCMENFTNYECSTFCSKCRLLSNEITSLKQQVKTLSSQNEVLLSLLTDKSKQFTRLLDAFEKPVNELKDVLSLKLS